MRTIWIEIKARYHPGVLSQISGIFMRKRITIEGIICGPLHGAHEMTLYILVKNDLKVLKIREHLYNMHDITDVIFRDKSMPTPVQW